VDEPTADQSVEPARRRLARALARTVLRTGDKATVGGRIVTAGLAVVLTGAVAMGVGAVIAHNGRATKTADAAAKRSLSASPFVKTASPSHSQRVYVPVPRNSDGTKGQNGRKASHKTSSAPTGSKRAPVMAALAQKTLVSNASGKCIDVTNEGQTGVPLQIWDCGPVTDWKLWSFYTDHTIRSMGKCMTLVGGSANGNPIELNPCRGDASQRFVLNGSSDLVNIAADKCVDVRDKQTANATRLQIWQCGGTSNQKWHTAG
jgi:hypothetical protein